MTIALQNHTRENITLKKGTKVGQVMAATIVPPALMPKCDEPEIMNLLGQTVTVPTRENVLHTEKSYSEYDKSSTENGGIPEYRNAHSENVLPPKLEPTPERRDALFSKLDLPGIEEWSEDNQQKVHDLMVEYQHLFALNDLELGCTDKVKHKIKFDNPVPFKD